MLFGRFTSIEKRPSHVVFFSRTLIRKFTVLTSTLTTVGVKSFPPLRDALLWRFDRTFLCTLLLQQTMSGIRELVEAGGAALAKHLSTAANLPLSSVVSAAMAVDAGGVGAGALQCAKKK